MKLIFALFCCFLLSFQLKSQAYQPMAVEGAHWISGWSSGNDYPIWVPISYSLSIRGDSILQNRNYKKLYYNQFFVDYNNFSTPKPYEVIESELIGLMRDDTVEQTVYYYPLSTNWGDYACMEEEYLMFDFSVQQGDTLDWCAMSDLDINQEGLSIVVDSVTQWRGFDEDFSQRDSVFTFIHTYGWFPVNFGLQPLREMMIIEGFGYYDYGPFLDGGVWGLSYCLGTDANCGILTSTKTLSHDRINIYPNPVADKLYIEQLPNDAEINIYHVSGQLIMRTLERDIDVSMLSKGIYFIQVFGRKGLVYRSTFVKN